MLQDLNATRPVAAHVLDVARETTTREPTTRETDPDLGARVVALEREVTTLREGLDNRQRIGFVTGLLAQRHGLQPDEAWALLARVSQDLNVKARRVAEVLLDAFCGRLAPADVALAARIAAVLPTAVAPTAAAPTAGLPTGGAEPAGR